MVRLARPAVRIAYVTHYQLPHLGGVELIVHQIATAMAERGHDVTVVSSAAGAGAGTPPAPYRAVRIPAVNVLEDRLGVPVPVYGPALIRRLRAVVARADVVHAHGWLQLSTAAAFALARGRSLRVLTEHVGHVPYPNPAVDAVERLAVATVGRACARAADALVTYNATVFAELERRAPGRPVLWIDNGVDTDRFRPAEPGERERLRAQLGWDGTPRVLFAGRPVAKKGFDVAVGAARLADGAWRLEVAGAGNLPKGTPAGVGLLGRLSPERIAQVYRAADAIVLPSRGEGFPLTAQEAMASGLPLVMTDDPGYRRLVAGAGPSVRLLAADAPAMAAALADAVRDRDDRPDAVAAMVGQARAAFSWSRAADEHEALYRELAETRRYPRPPVQ